MIQQTLERPFTQQASQRLAPPSNIDRKSESDPLKALVAGAVGGLAATLVMTLFQNAMTKLNQPLTRENESDERKQEQGESEPATVQAADAISRAVRGREIKGSHKSLAGQTMHYSFGTSMGIMYAMAAEYAPAVTAGRGSAFGTALMIGADEVAVPLAGLSDPPTQTPLSTHVYALVAHIVYGMACEQVRRSVRGALDEL